MTVVGKDEGNKMEITNGHVASNQIIITVEDTDPVYNDNYDPNECSISSKEENLETPNGDSKTSENGNHSLTCEENSVNKTEANGYCGTNGALETVSIIGTPKHTLKSLDSIAEERDEDGPTYLPKYRSRKKAEIGSENLITNDDLRLAATLVADAMQGQTYELKTEPRFVRSYNRYKSTLLHCLLYAAILINILLALCEKPAVPGIELPYWVTMSAEGVCQLFFIGRLCHHAHWRLWNGYKKDAKNIMAVVCILITVADMVAYIIVVEFTEGVQAVRWSRSLRPLVIMNFSDGTHLRRAWGNIRRTLNQIAHVIVLFYFLIVVFSLVAMKMFQNRMDMNFPDGSEYFKNYLESFWQLYVLVTTANNPDVMMPAYDKNRWYCLFFTVYIILCLYLMLNILLAVTYNSYRENMKNQIKHSARMKTKILHQAFEKIKINMGGKEMVTYKTWTRLIKLAHPEKTKFQIDLLMMVLDTDKSGHISRQQFLSVSDLLNVPLSEVSERKTFMEIHCPAIYLSKFSTKLITAVQTIYFSLLYDGVVIVNVIMICLNVEVVDWLFFALYFLEIILKWYAFGTKRYFLKFQHITDVIITLVSLVMLVLTEMKKSEIITADTINAEAMSVLNVFRIFRVLRCLVEFDRFRIIFDAVLNVSFSIFTYCGILFIVFYAFAIVGMEIFADKFQFLGYNYPTPTVDQLNCNNNALNNSLFSSNRYCKTNFNDLINAFVLLASLLIVNNWHVMCEGFVLVTSKAARIYFMMFHLCVAVVVMNIVTAFILDMFMHEYTFSKKGNIDTKVEHTIKQLNLGIDDETGRDIEEQKQKQSGQQTNTTGMHHTTDMFRRLTMRQGPTPKPNLSRYDGIRFHIKKRGWSKTELLLQQLFELEDDNSHTENDDLRSEVN